MTRQTAIAAEAKAKEPVSIGRLTHNDVASLSIKGAGLSVAYLSRQKLGVSLLSLIIVCADANGDGKLENLERCGDVAIIELCRSSTATIPVTSKKLTSCRLERA